MTDESQDLESGENDANNVEYVATEKGLFWVRAVAETKDGRTAYHARCCASDISNAHLHNLFACYANSVEELTEEEAAEQLGDYEHHSLWLPSQVDSLDEEDEGDEEDEEDGETTEQISFNDF